MPVFRFDKAFGIARDVKAFLNRATRGAPPDAEQHGEQAEYRKKIKSKRQALRQKKQALRQKKQELRQIKKESHAEKEHAKRPEHKKRKIRAQQEFFQLERELLRLEGELGTVEERAEDAPDVRPHPWTAGEPEATGALPDFAVIGAMKGGTTFLYYLLTQHPHVERAAKKELHFFDGLFEEEGIDWYRRCFPTPRWKDGRRTITGEATPGYLAYPLAAERMAKAVPQARLIALLRNPVDRAYSHHHHLARKGRETRTFEEAVEEAIEAGVTWPLVEEDKASEQEDRNKIDGVRYGYLARGIYVDQLLHWSKFFSDEQMLVLKSEDFFEHPAEALKPVLDFLGLPDWKPETSEVRNKGVYERGMDPATRRRLEEFFEPHNERLYEYLGKDFGW